MKARVHSFESFGTADGPGIRFVLFLQGCHLRCLYCHNPDTWSINAGTLYSLDELMQKILRYKPYFNSSGGGVTVSGGEPLLQAGFLVKLFGSLKAEGIHTCLDTSGNYGEKDSAAITELLNVTDLVLMDIKHMDDESHKRLTGLSHDKAFTFMRLLEEKNIPVWLRYVVVPGYTDNLSDIKAFKDYARSQPHVHKIEFLPFHKMGEFKWKTLCLPYQLSQVEPPEDDFIPRLYDL